MAVEQVQTAQSKRGLKKGTKIKMTREDKVFALVTYTVLSLLMIIMIYPFVYVAATSISQPSEVMK